MATAEGGPEASGARGRAATDGSRGFRHGSQCQGGRAITIANQSGAILNYHWPTDSAANISEPAFAKAVRFAAAWPKNLTA